jgi:hypothetical protein
MNILDDILGNDENAFVAESDDHSPRGDDVDDKLYDSSEKDIIASYINSNSNCFIYLLESYSELLSLCKDNKFELDDVDELISLSRQNDNSPFTVFLGLNDERIIGAYSNDVEIIEDKNKIILNNISFQLISYDDISDLSETLKMNVDDKKRWKVLVSYAIST